jgi:PIN like domain
MAANPASLRFFVDESLLGIGKALAYAREDVVHAGHPLVVPDASLGAKDTDWMPAVAGRGLAVFTRDRHLRTRPAEIEVLRTHGLRVFFLAGRRDLSNWGYLVRLVKRWDDVENVMRLHGPGPWFFAVHDARVAEVSL